MKRLTVEEEVDIYMGKLRLDNVLVAADLCRGNQTRAAERLGVTRWALVKFIRRTPRARQAFDEWRQKLTDEAETALWDCVAERQPWAIALVLKTLGKFRGYIEAQHLTPTGHCHLPQREDGQLDDGLDFMSRRPRSTVDEWPDEEWDEAADDDRWAQQEALIARQDEQLAALTAQLEAQAAHIRELEAHTALLTREPDPAPGSAADDVDEAELQALIAEVRQRLGR
jgi:hypothetical protein